jgi:putative tryptophan/tyrosine transport system substrate-binding protein
MAIDIGRRQLISALGGASVALSFSARAQQPGNMPTIGFLHSGTADAYQNVVATFRQGLKETGFVESQNVVIEYRWANNKLDQLSALAADLVHRKVAVIFAAGPQAVLAAKAATSTIPLVVALGGDPVKYGLATSLNRPDGNITGATFLTTELTSKRLEILCEVVPQARTVGYLKSGPQQGSPAMAQVTSDFLAAAHAMGRQAFVLQVDSDHDFAAAFASFVGRGAGALFIAGSVLFDSHDDKLAALALQHSMPASYQRREFVEAGGLMSYSASWDEAFRAAGLYVGRILKGAKPADLPFQESTQFELAINLKTAKILGLEIPPKVLSVADDVIE